MARVPPCGRCGTLHWSIQPCNSGTMPVVEAPRQERVAPLRAVHMQREVPSLDALDAMPKNRRWEAKNKDRYLEYRRGYMREYRKANK